MALKLVNNFRLFIASTLLASDIGIAKNVNGEVKSSLLNSVANQRATLTTSGGVSLTPYGAEGAVRSFMCIGSSDTPVQDADYTMGQPITEGIAGTTTSCGLSTIGPTLWTVSRSFTNTSSTDIEIKEVAIFRSAYQWNDGPGVYNMMLARDVLDEPITLAPGESKTFTYTIK